MPVSPPPPASPAEAAVREAARSAFDEALAEERDSLPHPPYPNPTLPQAAGVSPPYPAPGAEIGGPPPPHRIRSTLPGEGSYGPGCGAKRPLGWLSADGDFPQKYHACVRRECPRCAGKHEAAECPYGIAHRGGDWADSDTIVVATKVQGYGTTQGYGPERPLRQVIVSPPKERYDEADDHDRIIERVRRAAAKALRELGWGGRYWASLVVHLYRGCEREGYIGWGPHAHAVGPGVDVRKVEEYHRRTGVVVKQATEDGTPGSPFVGYWGKSLVRHILYELGHAAIVPNGHAVSYLGAGLRSYSPPEPEIPEEEKEAEEPKCPHGLPFVPLGDGSRPKYDPETREWTFRIDRDRFFRFLDRAPTQGGPLLEKVDANGRATPVAISPYLDQTGLREPRKRRWFGKPPPDADRTERPDPPPWDAPSNWPEAEP